MVAVMIILTRDFNIQRRLQYCCEGQMNKDRILHLTLHREYFAQIADGSKREEYRDRTAYWKARLEGRSYDIIRFRNGYGPAVPEMDVEWKGLNPGRKDCYAVRLGKILRLKYWPAR